MISLIQSYKTTLRPQKEQEILCGMSISMQHRKNTCHRKNQSSLTPREKNFFWRNQSYSFFGKLK